METTGKKPISFYFHIPFCQTKCPYCHFYVIKNDESKKDKLVAGFIKEWGLLSYIDNRKLESIYFGGGTPSLLGPSRIKRIIELVKSSNLEFSESLEITLEVNPCEVNFELARAYFEAGVNRISIGVQSLDDSSLKSLGRKHSKDQAIFAIDCFVKAGITNISIDLMYDRPNQTLEVWKNELLELKNLPITHLSLYNMTIEEGSSFKKIEKIIRKKMPDEEKSLALHQMAIDLIEEAGFERYEISAFAKNKAYSKHNLGYWQSREFYGLGPSAFSYINGSRFQNVSDFDLYLKSLEKGNLPISFHETLDKQASQNEMLAIGLRVSSGVHLEEFQKKAGTFSRETLKAIKQLLIDQYAVEECGYLKLTAKGQLFYDDVGIALI